MIGNFILNPSAQNTSKKIYYVYTNYFQIVYQLINMHP